MAKMRYGLIVACFRVAVKKSFHRELALLLGARDASRIMREVKTRYKECGICRLFKREGCLEFARSRCRII